MAHPWDSALHGGPTPFKLRPCRRRAGQVPLLRRLSDYPATSALAVRTRS